MANNNTQKHDDELNVNSFMGYMQTRPEEDPFSSKYNPSTSYTTGTGCISLESILRFLFIAAVGFLAITSPILCIIYLFVDIEFEGLWALWMITIAEIGLLIWYIWFGRKSLASRGDK